MKKSFMKKSLMLALAATCAIGLFAGCGSEKTAQKDTIKVGVVQLLEHPALDESRVGFIKGLADEGFVEGKNLEIIARNAQADQSNLNTIATQFKADKLDLIGAISTPAAQTVATKDKKTPIVGMAITSYEAAKLVKSNENPGGNVTGVSDLTPGSKQLELILKIFPNVKTVGTMYSTSEANSQYQVDGFMEAAKQHGIDVKIATVSSVNDVQQAAKNLQHQGIEVLYLPLDNVMASSFANLINMMTEAKIPVIPSDSAAMPFGALAVYSVNFEDLGRQAGHMAAAILKGEAKPATTPVQFPAQYRLFVNEQQAEKLGVVIPAELIKQAQEQ